MLHIVVECYWLSSHLHFLSVCPSTVRRWARWPQQQQQHQFRASAWHHVSHQSDEPDARGVRTPGQPSKEHQPGEVPHPVQDAPQLPPGPTWLQPGAVPGRAGRGRQHATRGQTIALPTLWQEEEQQRWEEEWQRWERGSWFNSQPASFIWRLFLCIWPISKKCSSPLCHFNLPVCQPRVTDTTEDYIIRCAVHYIVDIRQIIEYSWRFRWVTQSSSVTKSVLSWRSWVVKVKHFEKMYPLLPLHSLRHWQKEILGRNPDPASPCLAHTKQVVNDWYYCLPCPSLGISGRLGSILTLWPTVL